MKFRHTALTLTLAASFALAACGGEPEETTYEADATDVGGGELIVTEEDPAAVPVDTPDTPMTNVPAEDAAAAKETPGDAAPIAE